MSQASSTPDEGCCLWRSGLTTLRSSVWRGRGRRPNATHKQKNSSESRGLRKSRGLASSANFPRLFGGSWPRKQKRGRTLRLLSWRRI